MKEELAMNESQFQIYWSLVNGFWSHTQNANHKHKKCITEYHVGRISKPRMSSKALPEEKASGKTRVTAFHPPGSCEMKIKIYERLDKVNDKENTYRILRIRNALDHDYNIEQPWSRKRSSFLLEIFRNEMEKWHSVAEIKDRIKGVVI